MTQINETIAGSAGPIDSSSRRSPITPTRLTTALEAVLYLWVVALASWTISFHIAIAIGLTRNVTAVLWILLTATVSTWLFANRRADSPELSTPTRSVLPLYGVYGLAALLVSAALALWWPVGTAFVMVWTIMLSLLLSAAFMVLKRPSTPIPARTIIDRVTMPAVILVAVLALASGVLSAAAIRPDADDVFLVNRSTHTEQDSGQFAVRDTIFADETFASSRPPNPQIAVEALLGTVAAALPINAATTTYLLWGPLVSALAVLALWRLLRTLRAAYAELALVLASAYLLLNGGVHESLGNFGVVRSWQGKSALLMVIVPLLWHFGLRFGRSGKARDLLLLGAANVAAVGLSSSGIFIAPTVTGVAVLSGAAWLGGHAAVRRVGAGALAAVYPAGAALMVIFAGEQDRTPRILGLLAARRFDATIGTPEWPWYRVFDSGWGLGLAIFAILVAWITVDDRTSRLALIAAPIAVLTLFAAPEGIERINGLFTTNSVLWRSIWIMPVPAAIGLLLSAPSLLRPSRTRLMAIVLVPAIALGGLAMTQQSTLHPDNGVTLGRPGWDVAPRDRVALEQILALTEPGDVVAAPEFVGGAIAISTVEIRAINPRNTAVDQFDYLDEFEADLRLLLSWGVAFGIPDGRYDETRESLGVLGVDLLCIRPALDGQRITQIVAEEGYVNVVTDGECMYWRKFGTG